MGLADSAFSFVGLIPGLCGRCFLGVNPSSRGEGIPPTAQQLSGERATYGVAADSEDGGASEFPVVNLARLFLWLGQEQRAV